MTKNEVGTTIVLNDIYPCIQGEGSMTGQPMIMVRLQGCDVGCPWCDTKETWAQDGDGTVADWRMIMGTNALNASVNVSELAAHLYRKYPNIRWVLVSGGEPSLQRLKPLVSALHRNGFKVAIETSGTAEGHLNAGFDWVTVSPKHDMPGGKRVLPIVVAQADEIKQVIGKQEDVDKLVTMLARYGRKDGGVVSVQPISQSEKATKLCIETAMTRNWRLSIQVHKYISQR